MWLKKTIDTTNSLMNNILKKSLQNFKYVMSAQIVVLVLGIVKAIVIPMFLSIENFGYWQMYLFYASYVGVFSLGFNDGIYLRYGRYQYEELPHKKLRSTIRLHLITLFIFTIAMVFYSNRANDVNRIFVFWFISSNIIIMGLNGILIYVLQITNRMKEYSYYSILPKVILMAAAIVLSIFRVNNFKYLIIADFISKFVAVLGMILTTKELWVGDNISINEAKNEYTENLKVGIQLMIAQLMGMFVTGIGRFIVELFGNIEEFAYYSFGITLTNLVLVVISSASLILYPTLKRLNEQNYPIYYRKINSILRHLYLLVPIAFYGASFFISVFIPKYIPVLEYLNILFAVIVLQAKMQLLNNTFYKALRKETAMMKANISSVVFFTIIAFIGFSLIRNVLIIAICTFIVMAWRCYFSELYLTSMLEIKNIKQVIIEFVSIILFIVITSFIPNIYSVFVYVGFLAIYLNITRSEIKAKLSQMRQGG